MREKIREGLLEYGFLLIADIKAFVHHVSRNSVWGVTENFEIRVFKPTEKSLCVVENMFIMVSRKFYYSTSLRCAIGG